MRVYFIDRIRDEKSFNDSSLLKEAIGRDVTEIRKILQGVSQSEQVRKEVACHD